tara:strand:+ start:288233 stop:288355 length:123 start_codon:yes stop_codon:yes gene_type:complete
VRWRRFVRARTDTDANTHRYGNADTYSHADADARYLHRIQ